MNVNLGIIEGYFGRPWTWADRRAVMELLSSNGFGFFIYAPKMDRYLRQQWRDPFPDALASDLASFSSACRDSGVRFGVGISPFEAYLDFDGATRAKLADKLAALNEVGLDDLAILFDDMRGDVPDLAERQTEIVDFALARTSATHVLVCPTYYADDSVLDRAFGPRPPTYLEDLGERLDPSLDIFWTGEEVCAREFSPGHLDDVADRLGRKPFLWDNYPVNDGARMSQYLHIRAFTGRGGIADHIAGHAINPALQPTLGCIPALTLAESYAEGDDYCYGAALARAAEAVVGPELAALLRQNLISFQDLGRDRLGERDTELRARYSAIDHPAAREVVEWLDGGYEITNDMVRTQ